MSMNSPVPWEWFWFLALLPTVAFFVVPMISLLFVAAALALVKGIEKWYSTRPGKRKDKSCESKKE